MTKSKIPSLALQTLFQALSWSLGANTSLLPKFHPNLKIPRRNQIKFYPNSNLEASLNFHSKSTWNLKKFLYRKLFPSSNSSKPYFISKILSLGRFFFDQSKLGRI
jgi:hypothetical protein